MKTTPFFRRKMEGKYYLVGTKTGSETVSGIETAPGAVAVKVLTAAEGWEITDILDWNKLVNLGADATCGELAGLSWVATYLPPIILLSQHFLNFLPVPQWQRSLRPSFFIESSLNGLYYSMLKRKSPESKAAKKFIGSYWD